MQGDSPARTGRDAFDEKKCRLARESGRAPFVPEEVSRDATITANEGATEKGWRPAAPGVDAGGAPTTPAAAAFVAAFPAPPIDAGHARGVIASQTAGEPEEGPTTDVRLIRLDSVNTIPKSWYQASGNMGLLIDDVVYVAVFFLDREERITGLDLFFSSSAGLTITDCGRLGCTSHSRKRIVRIFGLLLQAYGGYHTAFWNARHFVNLFAAACVCRGDPMMTDRQRDLLGPSFFRSLIRDNLPPVREAPSRSQREVESDEAIKSLLPLADIERDMGGTSDTNCVLA